MDSAVAVESSAAAVATPLVANSSSSAHSSNSSSSNSSGYGSATTTPTNPASAGSSNSNSSSHSHYDAHSTTPVGTVEPIPVATVAAVTPYYSETYADSHQRSSYYQSHSYPMASQAQVMPHYNSYDSYLGAGTYQHMSSVERSGSSARHASSFAYASSEKLGAMNSKLPVSPSQQLHGHHTSNIGSSSTGAYGKLTAHTGESSNTSAKPQAAATPFYAQPLHATNQTPVGYFDPYKYNVPTKITSTDYANYGGHLPNAASATYQQHQQYYAAGKTLQDATYTAAVKPLPASPVNSRQHVSSPYATSGGGGGATNNSTYYDKYMYSPTATPAASTLSAGSMNPVTYPPHVPPPPSSSNHPPQYPPEMSADTYRKTPSWHWSMDYAAGNCRSLPPPPPSNSIPTAAVPPTNAAYLQQASSTRDMYYPHDKYAAGKYDKYNSYYHHQQYMSAARNVWPASPHSHLGPSIAERLPHLPPGATVAATHPSLPHHYASATAAAAASGATRQSCCTQPFQQQNCYYSRPPHLIAAANNYPPHAQQPHYAPTGANNANTNNGSGKYGMLDYAPHTNKTKSPTDLFAGASPYEAATAHLNYNYASSASANQHYVGSPTAATAHQSSLNPAIAPTQMHGDLSTAFYNDLNVQATYDNYASAAMQPTQHQQYQQYQQHQQHHAAATRTQPPSSYAANSAKASLLDYRKTTAATARQGVDCYMAQSAQLTNLDEHAAGGNSYAPYELNSVSSALYASRAEVESADKTGTNTKNLSLRDFLSTWNEDEEDYAASVGGATTDELNFIEPESQATESTGGTLQAGDRESGKHAAYVHDNVAGVAQSYKPTTASLTQQQQQQQIMENHLQFKSSFNTRPKIHVGITVDSTVDVETNQYINLPDIIIDIEKSNNVAPTLTPAKEEPSMEMKDIPFGSFDVEKELDELQSKKVKMPVVEVVRPIRSDSVITQKVEALKPAKASYECNVSSVEMEPTADTPSFKGLLLHATDADFLHSDNQVNATCSPKPIIAYTPPKMAPNQDTVEDEVAYALSTVHADAEPSVLDNPAQFIKDIECDNNSHSNESTFEKEYETFINKIGSDTDASHLLKDSNKANNTISDKVNADPEPPMDICKLKSDEVILCAETNEDIKRNSETEREFAQNIKAFSKFYKRKRKFSESRKDEKHKKPALEETALIANESRNINQNFPKGHTKKCRKRKDSERHTPQVNGGGTLSAHKHRMHDAYASKRKALAFYYKLLRAQRRFRFSRAKLDTSALVQRHIATLKERRLPLIKRQSAKKYSARGSRMCYNPKTLKCLSVGIVNTEAFRDGLLWDMENQAIKDIAIAVAKEELCADGSETQSSFNDDADVATPADKSDVEFIDKFANETEKPFADIIANEWSSGPKNVVPMQSNVVEQGHVDDNDDAEELKLMNERSNSSLNCTPAAMDVESGPMESIIADISLQSTVENTNANNVQEPSQRREVEEREEQGETVTANERQQFVENLPNANTDKNTDVFDTASQTTQNEPKLSFGLPANSLCSQANVTNNDTDNLLSESNKYVGVIEVDENSNASLTDNSSVSSDTSSSSSSSDNSTDSSSSSSSSDDDDDTLSNASEKSDLNELEELERELSQHRSVNDIVLSRVSEKFDDHTSDYEYGDMVRESSNAENVNDIANLKKMLEGDSDEHDERQSNSVKTVNKQSNITTDEDEATCGLQNSRNADKKQTTQNDCVDAVAVHSAVQVAGNEQCAVELHVEEVEQKSADVTQENLDAEQLTVREVEAISNEAQENLQDEVLEISDDDSEISEVLATTIDVLDTSEEELEHWDEVHEESNDVQKKFDNVQARTDEEQTKRIEISAQCDEVQPRSNEVRVECEKLQSKSIEVDTVCDEVQPKSNDVQTGCDELKLKSKEVREECDEVRSKSNDAKPKSNEVHAECDEVKSKSNEVKLKSNEVRAEYDEVRSKSNEVQAEYEELLPKSNEVQMGCDEVDTECNEVKSESNEVQAEYEELLPKSMEEMECDEVQTECDEVKSKSHEVQAECEDLLPKSIEEMECDEVKSTSHEVQAECEELLPKSFEEMECGEVQAECNEVKSESYEVQTEFEDLPPKSIEVQMECDEVQHAFNEVQAKCDEVPLKSIEVPTKSQEVLEDAVEEKKNPKTSASSVDDSDTPIASLNSFATGCIDLNGPSPRIHSLNQELVDQIGHNIADEFDQVEHKIPKLSDLCKIALSSSFETSAPTFISDTNASDDDVDVDADSQPKPLERELSVEEALAEMYRQAGVTSDPEDYDMEDKDAQDVLLINLEEILVSDSDLYVLQCDMNENVLSVVAHADAVEAASHANVTANAERVNGVQLMEVLDDLQRNEVDELQMTATCESVQNESETTAAASLSTNPTTMAPLTDKNADKATSTRTQAAASQIAEHEENNDNSLTSQFDLPTIHHEEIVPDNYKTFEKENFIKYLHAKYVQKNISKFYHANRILKKYKRRFCKN